MYNPLCADRDCFFSSFTGSMPPNSQFLWQEGMCVKSYKLVSEGKFQEDGKYIYRMYEDILLVWLSNANICLCDKEKLRITYI